jgi:hypothetical protein
MKPLIISLLLICAAVAFKLFVALPSMLTGQEQSGNRGAWSSGVSAVLLLIALVFLLSSGPDSFIHRGKRRRH